MNPQIFGWEHIVYFLIFVSLSIAGIFLIKKYCKSDKAKNMAIYIVAVVLLLSIITNRLSQVKETFSLVILLPDTWCSAISYTLAISCLIFKNKDHPVFHFIVYLALLGPTLTMFYPDFIGQNSSLFYLPTISGLIHHSIALFLAVLLIVLKYFKPTIKKWYALPIGSLMFVAYGVFLSNVFGKTGAMMVDGHSLIGGTPFTWYVVGVMYCAIVCGILGIIYFYNHKKEKKLQSSESDKNKN